MDSSALLMRGYSLEITGGDVDALVRARDVIPAGTRINVSHVGSEDARARLDAVRTVRDLGFVPVPHVSARRLPSRDALETFLKEAAAEHLFVVGGDPGEPAGPFPDALSVIRSGLLGPYAVRSVSIAGYPEGHPGIPDDVLWSSLAAKVATLGAMGIGGDIVTQFGFDVDPVLDWIETVRGKGIDAPVRVGVPGPVGVTRLLRYAARFGIATSAGIARKYGFSITNLLGTAGPERFLDALATDYHPDRHGDVRLHFFTFGAVRATAELLAERAQG